MRFTELFHVKKRQSDEWFDPVLSIDTKLFIDPFLIYRDRKRTFSGSHQEIISFFNDVFKLIAKTRGDQNHLFWKKSLGLLRFPEVEEICLGYATRNTKGAGSGTGFARIIAEALWEAVEAGIKKISHFEEIGIFREGIGADRISDITANLLRQRLANFTEAICQGRGIPCKRVKINIYSPRFMRWVPETMSLPQNPYNGRSILLVPERFLRDLPTISAENFWDFCYSNENETLRTDFGTDITRNVDKKSIIGFARKHPDLTGKFLSKVEKRGSLPYDQKKDKKGLIKWYESTGEYCQKKPKTLNFLTETEFLAFVESLLKEFKNYVENNSGWRLLWNDDHSEKGEEAAQRLFLGIVKHYCRANNVDISSEPNIGRGPVDFKVSQGSRYRALLELKLARNTKFWNGLARQLPTYQDAEGIATGYFLVVIQNKKDFDRIEGIKRRVVNVRKATGKKISHFIVDASRGPLSASKL